MVIVKPSAKLLVGGDLDDLYRIYSGYRICYSKVGVPERIEMESYIRDMQDFVTEMLKAERPHESPLEHASLTFEIKCSRTASHQLVRHRLASYSQRSQRYTEEVDEIIIPDAVATMDRDVYYFYLKHLEEAFAMYHAMVDKNGVKKEDARSILPNCCTTSLVVTMNCRELLHFFNERCCNHAQAEIRAIANQMLAACRDTVLAPIFAHAGPPCLRLKHCPSPKPCGQQPWKEA